MKKFIIFVIIAGLLFSCAKKEPARSPASDILADKISGKFLDLDIKPENADAKRLFGDDFDFTKIENFAVRQSITGEAGEIGIFKLYSDSSVDYVKERAAERVLKLQADAGELAGASGLSGLKTANNAEVRSYGNYIYYVSHGQKDRIFKLIEDELKGA